MYWDKACTSLRSGWDRFKIRQRNVKFTYIFIYFIYNSLIQFPPHFHQFQMLQVITIIRDQLLVHPVNDAQKCTLALPGVVDFTTVAHISTQLPNCEAQQMKYICFHLIDKISCHPPIWFICLITFIMLDFLLYGAGLLPSNHGKSQPLCD